MLNTQRLEHELINTELIDIQQQVNQYDYYLPLVKLFSEYQGS